MNEFRTSAFDHPLHRIVAQSVWHSSLHTNAVKKSDSVDKTGDEFWLRLNLYCGGSRTFPRIRDNSTENGRRVFRLVSLLYFTRVFMCFIYIFSSSMCCLHFHSNINRVLASNYKLLRYILKKPLSFPFRRNVHSTQCTLIL